MEMVLLIKLDLEVHLMVMIKIAMQRIILISILIRMDNLILNEKRFWATVEMMDFAGIIIGLLGYLIM